MSGSALVIGLRRAAPIAAIVKILCSIVSPCYDRPRCGDVENEGQ
jgi:hypothetical protein